MIFTKDHITAILDGRKTQTRRDGECRWKRGSVHQIRVSRFGKSAGNIRILDVRHERLGSITAEDARREGYSSVNSYKAAWERIYKRRWDDAMPVWVIDFELADGSAERPNQHTFNLCADENGDDGGPNKEGD